MVKVRDLHGVAVVVEVARTVRSNPSHDVHPRLSWQTWSDQKEFLTHVDPIIDMMCLPNTASNAKSETISGWNLRNSVEWI